jgi:adenine-specific DNA-methyltransferase
MTPSNPSHRPDRIRIAGVVPFIAMPVEKFQPIDNLDAERLEALKQLFPEAVADGRIQFDTLRDLLQDAREDDEPDAEHFGLFWHGKREARRLAAQPSRGSLAPTPGEGVDEATTENIFIEGDNLEVLKLLQKSYAGRIKMIYIDPPYNTGNDFIYKDDFKEPLDSYLRRTGQTDDEGALLTSNTRADGRFHSNWLNMIYPRLRLARNLLRDDGVIFVSIADHEIHNLRQVLSEIFGEENFIACVIWQKIFSPKNTARHFSEDHDYILVYAKNAADWTPFFLPRSEEADSRYSNPDNDSRGLWSSSDLTARNYYSEGLYEVTSPSGKKFKPSVGNYCV